MKLSVVIPCFNELATIESVIKSVKKCGIRSLEIIIVDDCSTDGTCELLRTLEFQVDRIIISLPQPRKRGSITIGI